MTNIQHKCLVIPGPFVPANEPMTLLVYKQLRLLPLSFDVCALKYWEDDPSIQKKLSLDPCYNKFDIRFVDRYQSVLFSIRNINLPAALHAMNRYIETAVSMYSNQEYIYTSSFPCYTIRAAHKIKEKNKFVKWIANFTDPINHSPYVEDPETYRSYSLPEKIAFKLYCKYYVVADDEACAFEEADILLFICEEQREFMIQQYIKYYAKVDEDAIRNKSLIIPLNYVPEWNDFKVTESPSAVNNRFTLAHFGRVYGLRQIRLFILAVKTFTERHPNFDLKVEQYGEFRKSDLQLIHQLSLDSVFQVNEKIPYQACIQKMNKANAVLIFDTILNNSQLQPYLPSKILEYSMLNKNVLGIAMKTSPTFRIMKNSGAIVSEYQHDDIVEALENICIRRTKSTIDYKYTNAEAVLQLIQKINETK